MIRFTDHMTTITTTTVVRGMFVAFTGVDMRPR